MWVRQERPFIPLDADFEIRKLLTLGRREPTFCPGCGACENWPKPVARRVSSKLNRAYEPSARLRDQHSLLAARALSAAGPSDHAGQRAGRRIRALGGVRLHTCLVDA